MYHERYDEPIGTCAVCGGVVVDRLGERCCSSCSRSYNALIPDQLLLNVKMASDASLGPAIWRVCERVAVRMTRQRVRAARKRAAYEAWATRTSSPHEAGPTVPSRSRYQPGAWTGD